MKAMKKSAAYFFSMFQKIVTGDSSMPLMFLRIATGVGGSRAAASTLTARGLARPAALQAGL
jgi:hypothetical protein